MRKKYIIYKITNILNGKSYIGLTYKAVEKRWNEHVMSSKYLNRKFHRAIRKMIKLYGDLTNFKIEILQENIGTITCANKIEKCFIEKYNTFKNGYNSTIGGDGTTGHKVSKKSKEKAALIIKSHWENGRYDHIKGNNSPTKRPEVKKKMSEKASKRTKEKNPFFGKHHSDKTKKQISNSLMDRYKGELNPSSKLITLEVIEIKKYLFEKYYTIAAVARLFPKVSDSTIRLIKLGVKWGHIKI